MPGQRILKPAWRAPDRFAAIPIAMLDPPLHAASPAVPALRGSGSPVGTITTAAAIMGILFIDQTHTGFSMARAAPDTIATISGLITPVLVWATPNKKVA